MTPLRKSLQNWKGLTLIEMMISLVVLSMVLLSGIFVLVQARQMGEDSRLRLLAANAAKSTLEAIENTPLANLATINTANYVPAGLTNGTITITTNPSSVATATLATVTVRVQWRGPKNALRQIDVTTMRSSY